MKKVFTINIKVGKPILIGQDEIMGRRQLIPIIEGELIGENIRGIVLEGGVDSQIIKPNGVCELSARYGISLEDGNGIYIENNGIRTVPEEYIETVKKGNFIDPQLYYFKTTPKFEVYSEKYSWLTKKIFICEAKRTLEKVILDFFEI